MLERPLIAVQFRMSEINEFVRRSLGKGATRPEISAALEKAGWDADAVEAALSEYVDVEFPVPVPRPHRSSAAREAFLYLATFVAMYMTAFALGVLAVALVESLIPPPEGASWIEAERDVAWNIAALIIAAPTYFFLARSHLKAYAVDSARRTSPIRRWLSHLTMLVAFIVILTRLVAVLQQAFMGDLILSTALKSVAILLIAAAVYLYYNWELKVGGSEAAH
jgi:cation transport ATPase